MPKRIQHIYIIHVVHTCGSCNLENSYLRGVQIKILADKIVDTNKRLTNQGPELQ